MARRGWPVTRPVRHVGVLPLTIFPIDFLNLGLPKPGKPSRAWHVDKCVGDRVDAGRSGVRLPLIEQCHQDL
jgi:hypothetical protein